MHEFTDVLNPKKSLRVTKLSNAIRLGIRESIPEGGWVEMFFYLSPDDFGDLAAALWECSPTKQPIKIMSTTNEGETAKGTND